MHNTIAFILPAAVMAGLFLLLNKCLVGEFFTTPYQRYTLYIAQNEYRFTGLTPEFPDIVLRGAARLIPGLKQYYDRIPQPVVHYGGYYTKTRENLPVIGPLDVKGAWVVGALSGFGIMVGCAAGELTAAWISGGTLPGYARDLSPGRFQDPRYTRKIREIQEDGEL